MTLDEIIDKSDAVQAVKAKRLKDVGRLDGRVGNPRILTIDIETSAHSMEGFGLFNQNFSLAQVRSWTQIISFAAKWYGERPMIFKSDFHDGHAAMLEGAFALVNEADIVVHYNGTTFDMKHLNREFALAGFGPASPYKNVDLLRVVKSNFRFGSNKLDHIAQQFGLGGKLSHPGAQLWADCMHGDDKTKAKAWALMKRYNIKDTKLTEELYDVLRPWIKAHPHMGVMASPDEIACNRCHSLDLVRSGEHTVNLIAYAQYKCNRCGGFVKGERLGRIANSRGV
jgi:hypothetical protein